MTTAADVMSQDLITINATTPFAKIGAILERMHVRHLPVVDDDGRLVGMVSDRDVHRVHAVAERAGDALGAELLFATPGDDLLDIVRLMIDHRVGAIPIVDDAGRAIGIVSYVDALRVMAEEPDRDDPPLEVIDVSAPPRDF